LQKKVKKFSGVLIEDIVVNTFLHKSIFSVKILSIKKFVFNELRSDK